MAKGASGGSKRGWGGSGGFGGGGNATNLDSLISEREGNQAEVDAVLTVYRDVNNEFGTVPTDSLVGDMPGQPTMAYYDSADNLVVNRSYFNNAKMDKAYADCVKSGFHPSAGDKSGLQAVVAHEVGHTLTERAAGGFGNIDKFSNALVKSAAKATSDAAAATFARKISGYAGENAAEAIAEAFSDVYCNGRNAHKESHAIVDELKKYLKKS